MAEDKAGNLQELQKKLPLSVKDQDILLRALLHPSYVNENGRSEILSDYERLEFLGDAVLGLVIADHLCEHYADLNVGELTQLKALLVSEESLSRLAKSLDIGSYVLLGKGEQNNRIGRDRPALLADVLEAIIGAVYLDSGIEGSRQFILHLLGDQVQICAQRKKFCDYKSLFQQECCRRFGANPTYKVLAVFGPEYRRGYEVEARAVGRNLGIGIALSKKRAEQLAARHALRVMVSETEIPEEVSVMP